MLSAVDPANVGAGLMAGPVSAPIANTSSQFAITAGVFTNPQVPNPPAQIALLSGSPSSNTGLVVTFYAVDANLNVHQTGQPLTLNLGPTTPNPSVIAIAAGRFSGAAYDQWRSHTR